MEFPVCSFDLKTGIFCPSCESKIRSGEITELDIKIMRLLQDLEKNIPQLAGLHYRRSVKVNNFIFIVFKEGDLAKLPIPQQANLRKRLSESLGREFRVRIIEDLRDTNRFIQSLVSPARIVAINRIWLPDQTEEMRILDHERNLKVSQQVVEEVVKRIKGVVMRIDFERRARRRPAAAH